MRCCRLSSSARASEVLCVPVHVLKHGVHWNTPPPPRAQWCTDTRPAGRRPGPSASRACEAEASRCYSTRTAAASAGRASAATTHKLRRRGELHALQAMPGDTRPVVLEADDEGGRHGADSQARLLRRGSQMRPANCDRRQVPSCGHELAPVMARRRRGVGESTLLPQRREFDPLDVHVHDDSA